MSTTRSTGAYYRPLGVVELLDMAGQIYRQGAQHLLKGILIMAGGYALIMLLWTWLMNGFVFVPFINWDFLITMNASVILAMGMMLVTGVPLVLGMSSLFVHVVATTSIIERSLEVGTFVYLGSARKSLLAPKRSHPVEYRVLLLSLLILPLNALTASIVAALGQVQFMFFIEDVGSIPLLEFAGVLLQENGPMLLFSLLAVIASTRFALAIPAVMIEGISPLRAIQRSWVLSRGAFWPTAALLVLICLFQALLMSAPASLLFVIPEWNILSLRIASMLASVIELLAFPMLPIALMLLYFSQRIHYEGYQFDIGLAQMSERHIQDLHKQLSQSYFDGRSDMSLAIIEQILKEVPDDTSALTNRLYYYLNSGKPEEALKDAERVLALLPKSPYALANRAVVLERLGNHAGASADMHQALRLQRSFPKEVEREALRHYQNGWLTSALSYLDMLVLLMPNAATAHYSRARVLARRGQGDRALTALQRAIELDPRHRAQARDDTDVSLFRSDSRFALLLQHSSAEEP